MEMSNTSSSWSEGAERARGPDGEFLGVLSEGLTGLRSRMYPSSMIDSSGFMDVVQGAYMRSSRGESFVSLCPDGFGIVIKFQVS